MASKLAVAMIVLVAITVMVVATGSASPAQAQCDDDYLPCVNNALPPLADVSVAIGYTPKNALEWRITAKNNRVGKHPGTAVRTLLVRITKSNADGDDVSEMWAIRDLQPGASVTTTREPAAVDGPHRIHAEIIETDPVEPPGSQYNNKTENWAWGVGFTNGDAGVGISITGSDRFPGAGGSTTFMVHAVNQSWPDYEGIPAGGFQSRQVDVQVKITPSPGLVFSSTQQAPTGTTFDPNTGIWSVDAIEKTTNLDYITLPVVVGLTNDSFADLPLDERCLTAEVTEATPWFALHHHKRANDITTVCLGEDPKVLLNQSDIPLFYWHDCVGVDAHPCTSDDTLELVVQVERSAQELQRFHRRDSPGTFNRGPMLLQPETIIVHVQDPGGRFRNKWRTGTTSRHTDGRSIPGVGASIRYVPSSSWSQFTRAISDVSPKQRPGSLALIGGNTGTWYMLDADTNPARSPSNLSASLTSSLYSVYLEFGTLGTYKINANFGATKSGTAYADIETYTFHVGPIADLGVRDAGGNPNLSSGQRAYTVMALSKGPDTPPAAQVMLEDVPRETDVIPSKGTYTRGVCTNDLCDGTWHIGGMRFADARRNSGLPEGPTLTFITDDAEAPEITATIKNAQDYSVCIDSDGEDVDASAEAACEATTGNSWHSTEYYDYIPDNNQAKIHARAGTRDGHPDAPAELKVLDAPFANVLLWEPVKAVNGFSVVHYEMERSTGTWESIAGGHQGTIYIDLDNPGQAQYRVRAVNIFGVPGPWSALSSGGLPVPLLNPIERLRPGELRISWSPVVGAVLVKAYELHFSYDGESFRRLAIVPAGAPRSYTHTGAAPNRDVYYRVRAIPTEGQPSPWSQPESLRIPLGALSGLRAQANGPSEIVLEWNQVEPGGAQFSEYEIESSEDGEEWLVIANLYDLERTSYVDRGLDPGTTWHYRIRVNTHFGGEVLRGEWSQVVRATTDSGGPEYGPTNLTATASVDDRARHYITLTWGEVEGSNITYRIEVSSDGENWESLRDRYLTRTYNHANLSPGVEYRYRVAARNLSGMGPFSDAASATTGDPADPPGKPLNMRFTDVSQSQVTFTWEAPEDDGGSPVTGYEYMYYAPCGSDAAATCESAVKSTRGTRATVSGLTVPGSYQFVVRAVNAVGPGDWTEGIFTTISPQARGKVTVSPTALTIGIGESKTFRVKLGTSPTWPVAVYLAWGLEDDPLLDSLEWQQGRILLPSSWAKPTEGDPWYDFAYRWNEGIPITVTVAEEANPGEIKGVEALIQCDVIHVPEKDLEDYLGEPVENWEPDPAYDGMACPSIRVTGE